MGRKWLALAIQVPFVTSMYLACGPGGGNGDAGPDSTAMDAVPDKKLPPDVNNSETPMGCAPANTIDMSMVTWTPPTTPNPTACSDQQIADLYTNCFSSTATSTTCNNWLKVTSNANCNKCMESSEGTSTAFSALINTSHNVVYLNVGGCIALVQNDTSMTSCAAKYWETSECEDLACSANCPITPGDQTSFNAYVQCTNAAATAPVCAPYVSAECNLGPDAGADAAAVYNTCFAPLSSFQNAFPIYGALFCGGYPADGGVPSDAGADAPADAPADGG